MAATSIDDFFFSKFVYTFANTSSDKFSHLIFYLLTKMHGLWLILVRCQRAVLKRTFVYKEGYSHDKWLFPSRIGSFVPGWNLVPKEYCSSHV